jgi:chromosome segregation ATPase
MSDSKKEKNESPFVKTVLALDSQFSELQRISAYIDKLDMSSDSDLDKAQVLIQRFTECGDEVSKEIIELSKHLTDSRERAEKAAEVVSVRAEEMRARKEEIQKKVNEFQTLGKKVHALTSALNEIQRPAADFNSDEDKAQLHSRLSEFEVQLQPIIEETKRLKEDAHHTKMRTLERQADSLSQSLAAVRQKLIAFTRPGHLEH